MVFATSLGDTFKVFAIFWTDGPSVFEVMMDCHFSLVLALI